MNEDLVKCGIRHFSNFSSSNINRRYKLTFIHECLYSLTYYIRKFTETKHDIQILQLTKDTSLHSICYDNCLYLCFEWIKILYYLTTFCSCQLFIISIIIDHKFMRSVNFGVFFLYRCSFYNFFINTSSNQQGFIYIWVSFV